MIRKALAALLVVALAIGAPAAAAVATEDVTLEPDQTLLVDIEWSETADAENDTATIAITDDSGTEQVNESVVAEPGNWTSTEYERTEIDSTVDNETAMNLTVSINESSTDAINQTAITTESDSALGGISTSEMGVIGLVVIVLGVALYVRE